MLDRMETIELKALPVRAAIQIPEPPHVGRTILRLEDVEFGYPERPGVLKGVNLEIRKGDHVAVIGLNGAGKSTLLKGLAGTLTPTQGTREVGYQVQIAIFNQHVVEVLDPADSVYESLEKATGTSVTPQDIRNMAGSLLFSTEQIEKKIKVLSGGEKSRVALGRILLQKVPCLLLDEPTNHLDFQTVEALTQALTQYKGTLIVVSHDRSFIRRVGTKILEVLNGGVEVYPGSYDDYVWSLQRSFALEASKEIAESPTSAPQGTNSFLERKELAKTLRQKEKRLDTLQSQIEKAQAKNLELNEKIAGGTTDPETVQELPRRHILKNSKMNG